MRSQGRDDEERPQKLEPISKSRNIY
jgi:hypothetical protein